MTMQPETTSGPIPHEEWGEHVERRLRGELDGPDCAAFEHHISVCRACREWAAAAAGDAALVSTATSQATASFDFERAKRATQALLTVRQRQSRVLTGWALGLAAVPFVAQAAAGMVPSVWEFIAVGVFWLLPLALLLVKDRWVARRARDWSAVRTIAAASESFERRIARSMNLFTLNQLGVLSLFAFGSVYGVRCINAGHDVLGWSVLSVLALLAEWQWHRTFAPAARRREHAMLRGELSAAEYHAQRGLWSWLRRPLGDDAPHSRKGARH